MLIMEKLREVASYICMRYQKDYGKRIDEMKLHKLLYFAQRECLVQLCTPLFPEKFQAWKYGPVLVSVRHLYKEELLDTPLTEKTVRKYAEVFEKVFSQYAVKDSWSLSALTHGEYSWKHARQGVPDGENCTNEMDIDDIRVDAQRIKTRRFMLSIIKKSN